MPRIEWTREAERAAFRLPARARADLLRVIAYLRDHPELGEMVSEGRFRGHRKIAIARDWQLFYRVIGPGRDCRLATVRHSRQRPV